MAEFDLKNIPDNIKPHDLFTYYPPEQVAVTPEAVAWLVGKLRAEREAFLEKEAKPKRTKKSSVDLNAKVGDVSW